MRFLRYVDAFFLLLAFCCAPAYAKVRDRVYQDDFRKSVLYLTGESEMENVGESEIELYWDLAETPLRINASSRSRLLSSGLFSEYQVASLIDYMERSGAVSSYAELSLIEGFNPELVSALKLFVSVNSSMPIGMRSGDKRRTVTSLMTNVSFKSEKQDGMENSLSAWQKCRVEQDGLFDAGIALKKPYGSSKPSSYSGYLAFYGKRKLEQIIIGDYSLRCGQGLSLWSGFSMSGFSGDRSFWKRPSGISASRSLSDGLSHRGVAMRFGAGLKVSLSAFVSFPGFRKWSESSKPLDAGIMPGLNATWYGRHGTVSFSGFCQYGGLFRENKSIYKNEPGVESAKVSVDSRFTVRGAELAGEVAFNIRSEVPAAVGSAVVPFADDWKWAVYGRWIPQDFGMEFAAPSRAFSNKDGEWGVATGLFYKNLDFTVDYACPYGKGSRQQLKFLVRYDFSVSEAVSMSFRVSERLRSYDRKNRTDVRADLKYVPGRWNTFMRLNGLMCKGISGLFYFEEGYVTGRSAVFLRGTMYIVDNWDDRIYSYERDAPGAFNVPAYYGRGYALSLAARRDFRFAWSDLKIYFRAGYVSNPWKIPGNDVRRPSKLELKLQVAFKF